MTDSRRMKVESEDVVDDLVVSGVLFVLAALIAFYTIVVPLGLLAKWGLGALAIFLVFTGLWAFYIALSRRR